MTVSELIDKLQGFNPEAELVFYDGKDYDCLDNKVINAYSTTLKKHLSECGVASVLCEDENGEYVCEFSPKFEGAKLKDGIENKEIVVLI